MFTNQPIPATNIKRQACLTLAGFVLTFIAGDWILSRLHLPYAYGSRSAARAKIEMFEQSSSSPDLVVLGSSHELCAVNPMVLDAEVSRISGRAVRSLNLAASSTSAHTQALMIRRILEGDRLPAVVYLGVCPAGADTTQRWWVLNGLRAFGRFSDLPEAIALDANTAWDVLRTALFPSRFRWEDSRLIMQRLVLGAPLWPYTKLQIREDGWAEWVGGHRSLPRTRAPREVPVDGAGLAPGNVNATALCETVRALQEKGVVVRLLETPLSTVASNYDRADTNLAYRKWIDATVAATGVKLVQPPPDLMDNASDYFDPVHMTPAGAEKFSRWLAADAALALQNARYASAGAGDQYR